MNKLKFFLGTVVSILLVACTSSRAISSQEKEVGRVINSKVVFINASQNKDGNTVKMAKDLLNGIDYEQINLVDYDIAFLGQKRENDQFEDFLANVENAETIVIGTPVYWHSMSGSLKTLIDRFYELQNSKYSLEGKNLYFFMQGSTPTEISIDSTEYIIQRVAAQTGMNLIGMADTDEEIKQLHETLINK